MAPSERIMKTYKRPSGPLFTVISVIAGRDGSARFLQSLQGPEEGTVCHRWYTMPSPPTTNDSNLPSSFLPSATAGERDVPPRDTQPLQSPPRRDLSARRRAGYHLPRLKPSLVVHQRSGLLQNL